MTTMTAMTINRTSQRTVLFRLRAGIAFIDSTAELSWFGFGSVTASASSRKVA